MKRGKWRIRRWPKGPLDNFERWAVTRPNGTRFHRVFASIAEAMDRICRIEHEDRAE